MRRAGWQPSSGAPSTGSRGDVVRKHRPDYLIALYTAILMLLGLVIIYAIGPQRANVLNNALGSNYSENYFVIKQVISILLAAGAFISLYLLSYKLIVKWATPLLVAGFVACLVLALAGVMGLGFADEINGATRWFNLGILGSFQPSELLKFGFLVYLAVFLGARAKAGEINDFKKTLLPVAIVTGIAFLFVIVIQKDLGTGVSLAAILAMSLFVAGINKKVMLIAFGGLIVLGLLFVVMAPHRMARVFTFLQGDETSIDDPGAYHIQHAKIAIGSGGFWGVGIGNSVQATGYVPEAINDSVFAILGETFGFIGLVSLITLFVALLMRLLRLMDHLVEMHLKLLVAGVFGWFGAHVILNIAAMIGIFPLTGITLPLLSFGGTSMLFMAAALGLMLQLSRYTIHTSRLKEANTNEDSGSRGRVGRTRHTSRRSS